MANGGGGSKTQAAFGAGVASVRSTIDRDDPVSRADQFRVNPLLKTKLKAELSKRRNKSQARSRRNKTLSPNKAQGHEAHIYEPAAEQHGLHQHVHETVVGLRKGNDKSASGGDQAEEGDEQRNALTARRPTRGRGSLNAFLNQKLKLRAKDEIAKASRRGQGTSSLKDLRRSETGRASMSRLDPAIVSYKLNQDTNTIVESARRGTKRFKKSGFLDRVVKTQAQRSAQVEIDPASQRDFEKIANIFKEKRTNQDNAS